MFRSGLLGGAGEGNLAFCSGGDQSVRGEGGYVGPDKIPRLNVLDLQASPHLPDTSSFVCARPSWQQLNVT